MYGCLYGGRSEEIGAIYESGMRDRDQGIYSKRGREAKVKKGWDRAMKTETKHDRRFRKMNKTDNAIYRGKSYDKKNITAMTRCRASTTLNL